MTKKSFSICRLIAVSVVSIVVSVFINLGNWYLPIAAIAVSWISLYILRRKVDEVIADERDYKVAGKASGLAMNIHLIFSVIAGIVFYSFGRENAILFNIATTLLYSACFLMVLYAVLFKIYERKE
jgi:uncharacterized membrane protein